MEYKIKIFETSTGKRPFDKWLDSLSDKKAQAAVSLRLERLSMGNFGDCRSIGDSVYELKFNLGSGYRIYFCKIGRQIVLLLCAGDKHTQQKDIEKAKKYVKEFKNSEKIL